MHVRARPTFSSPNGVRRKLSTPLRKSLCFLRSRSCGEAAKRRSGVSARIDRHLAWITPCRTGTQLSSVTR